MAYPYRDNKALKQYMARVVEREKEMEENNVLLLRKVDKMDQKMELMSVHLEKINILKDQYFRAMEEKLRSKILSGTDARLYEATPSALVPSFENRQFNMELSHAADGNISRVPYNTVEQMKNDIYNDRVKNLQRNHPSMLLSAQSEANRIDGDLSNRISLMENINHMEPLKSNINPYTYQISSNELYMQEQSLSTIPTSQQPNVVTEVNRHPSRYEYALVSDGRHTITSHNLQDDSASALDEKNLSYSHSTPKNENHKAIGLNADISIIETINRPDQSAGSGDVGNNKIFYTCDKKFNGPDGMEMTMRRQRKHSVLGKYEQSLTAAHQELHPSTGQRASYSAPDLQGEYSIEGYEKEEYPIAGHQKEQYATTVNQEEKYSTKDEQEDYYQTTGCQKEQHTITISHKEEQQPDTGYQEIQSQAHQEEKYQTAHHSQVPYTTARHEKLHTAADHQEEQDLAVCVQNKQCPTASHQEHQPIADDREQFTMDKENNNGSEIINTSAVDTEAISTVSSDKLVASIDNDASLISNNDNVSKSEDEISLHEKVTTKDTLNNYLISYDNIKDDQRLLSNRNKEKTEEKIDSDEHKRRQGSTDQLKDKKDKRSKSRSARRKSRLHSESSSSVPESDDGFFDKKLPITSSAAYKSLLGGTSTLPKVYQDVESESESEDDVERTLANAIRKSSSEEEKVPSSPEKNLKSQIVSNNQETVVKKAQPDSVQASKKPSTIPATGPKQKLSKASRKVLGLDSDSDIAPPQPSIKQVNEEDSDEFDFFN